MITTGWMIKIPSFHLHKACKCNIQIINGIKSPANIFVLVIIKIPKRFKYSSGHHIICHKTHKTKSVKLKSTFQSIQKFNNWGSQTVINSYRYRNETQSLNNSQINHFYCPNAKYYDNWCWQIVDIKYHHFTHSVWWKMASSLFNRLDQTGNRMNHLQ